MTGVGGVGVVVGGAVEPGVCVVAGRMDEAGHTGHTGHVVGGTCSASNVYFGHCMAQFQKSA